MSIDNNPTERGRGNPDEVIAEHNRSLAEEREKAFREMDNLPTEFEARSLLEAMQGPKVELSKNEATEVKRALKTLYDDLMSAHKEFVDPDEDYDEKREEWVEYPSLSLRLPKQPDGSWIEAELGPDTSIEMIELDPNGVERASYSYQSDGVGKPVYRRKNPDFEKERLVQRIESNKPITLDTPLDPAALIGSPESVAEYEERTKRFLANIAFEKEIGLNYQGVSMGEIQAIRELLEQAEPYYDEDD